MRPLMLLGLLLVLALLPLATDLEVYATPAEVPGHQEGSYIDLPSGRTHYVRSGTGPTLFLIAGLTGNYTVWDRSTPYLSQSFTTIAYDNFGRGFSERRNSYSYDRHLYRTQLLELMAALQVTRASIAGTSMGGAIAIDFAARYPERVEALVLVDNAGLPFPTPAVRNLVNIPGLGEYLFALLTPLVMHQGFERGFHDSSKADARFRHRYNYSSSISGFRRAVLESLRTMPLHELRGELEQLAGLNIPTLVVWGKEDRIVPFEVYNKMRRLLPASKGVVMHDAGHMPHAERPNLFGSNVSAFLLKSRNPVSSAVGHPVDN